MFDNLIGKEVDDAIALNREELQAMFTDIGGDGQRAAVVLQAVMVYVRAFSVASPEERATLSPTEGEGALHIPMDEWTEVVKEVDAQVKALSKKQMHRIMSSMKNAMEKQMLHDSIPADRSIMQ